MVTFSIFLFSIQENISYKTEERQNNEMKEVATTIKEEIDFASQSIEGYTREFTIPEKISGGDYGVSIQENILRINTSDGDHSMTLSVKNVTGQINKTFNRILKENGKVKLNP